MDQRRQTVELPSTPDGKFSNSSRDVPERLDRPGHHGAGVSQQQMPAKPVPARSGPSLPLDAPVPGAQKRHRSHHDEGSMVSGASHRLSETSHPESMPKDAGDDDGAPADSKRRKKEKEQGKDSPDEMGAKTLLAKLKGLTSDGMWLSKLKPKTINTMCNKAIDYRDKMLAKGNYDSLLCDELSAQSTRVSDLQSVLTDVQEKGISFLREIPTDVSDVLMRDCSSKTRFGMLIYLAGILCKLFEDGMGNEEAKTAGTVQQELAGNLVAEMFCVQISFYNSNTVIEYLL